MRMDEMPDAAASFAAVLPELRKLYEEYTANADAFFRQRAAGSALRALFAGEGRYGNCPLHDAFLAAVGEKLADLTALLQAGDPGPAGRRCAGEVLEYMLLAPNPGPEHPAGLCLTAAEYLAAPLIPWADTEALRDVCARYDARFTRRLRPLPNQEKLRRAMRKELDARGGGAAP